MRRICHNKIMFKNIIEAHVKGKHIYLCHVDGYIGAFNPYTNKVRYETADKFIPFVKQLIEDFPDYSPHNIVNYGIEEAIRKKIIADRILAESKKKNRE